MTKHKVLKPFWIEGAGDLKKGATTPALDTKTREHLIKMGFIDKTPVSDQPKKDA